MQIVQSCLLWKSSNSPESQMIKISNSYTVLCPPVREKNRSRGGGVMAIFFG